jgi:hypothetical protein
MPIATYSDLQATVADFLNRNDAATLAAIPTFVTLAEGDIRVDLRSRAVTLKDDINVDGPSVSLPSDIKVVRSLYDEFGPIRMVAPEEIARLQHRHPAGGRRADFAAILSEDAATPTALTLLVSPTPQEAMNVTMVYEPDLSALSDSNPTNWLLVMHPNIYLYAALKHSATYLRDDDRVGVWEKLYQDSMSKLTRLRDEIEFGAGPLVAMPRHAF